MFPQVGTLQSLPSTSQQILICCLINCPLIRALVRQFCKTIDQCGIVAEWLRALFPKSVGQEFESHWEQVIYDKKPHGFCPNDFLPNNTFFQSVMMETNSALKAKSIRFSEISLQTDTLIVVCFYIAQKLSRLNTIFLRVMLKTESAMKTRSFHALVKGFGFY